MVSVHQGCSIPPASLSCLLMSSVAVEMGGGSWVGNIQGAKENIKKKKRTQKEKQKGKRQTQRRNTQLFSCFFSFLVHCLSSLVLRSHPFLFFFVFPFGATEKTLKGSLGCNASKLGVHTKGGQKENLLSLSVSRSFFFLFIIPGLNSFLGTFVYLSFDPGVILLKGGHDGHRCHDVSGGRHGI